MFVALDKYGKRVYIDDTSSNEEYFCPCPSCKEKLIVRKGQINVHHFAHRPNTKCTDYWHEDMSEWHKYWQSLFPVEMQEIYKEKDGLSHRADVLIEKTKTVLEFQHSPLSIEEFEDRNTFYNNLGYRVIWIFDVSDKYLEGTISSHGRDFFSWSHPKKTFSRFNAKQQKNKVELYFQIKVKTSLNDAFNELEKLHNGGYSLGAEDLLYLREHRDDMNELVRVTWNPDDGFKRFTTDGYFYSEKDIISRYFDVIEENSKSARLGDLFDILTRLFASKHTTYYSGCSVSSTHICADMNIEMSGNQYDEIMPCVDCEYNMNHVFGHDVPVICKKRFIDTGLSPNTQVEVLEKNEYGFITKIQYEKNGTKNLINLPTFVPGKTIFELWKDKYEFAIFVNVITAKCVKIVKDPRVQYRLYGKVKGYFSSRPYLFTGQWCDIYGCNKPEWFCIQNKEKE